MHVERVFSLGNACAPCICISGARRTGNTLSVTGNADLLINLGACLRHSHCSARALDTGVRDYRERGVVATGYRDFHRRRDTLRDLTSIFAFGEELFGSAAASGDGKRQEEDSDGDSGEDADRQAEPVEKLSVVGYAHCASMDLRSFRKKA